MQGVGAILSLMCVVSHTLLCRLLLFLAQTIPVVKMYGSGGGKGAL